MVYVIQFMIIVAFLSVIYILCCTYIMYIQHMYHLYASTVYSMSPGLHVDVGVQVRVDLCQTF